MTIYNHMPQKFLRNPHCRHIPIGNINKGVGCSACLRVTLEALGYDWQGWYRHATRLRSLQNHWKEKDQSIRVFRCMKCLRKAVEQLGLDWFVYSAHVRENRLAQWKKENLTHLKETKKNKEARRRAKKQGNGGEFTAKEWAQLLILYQYRCVYCGKKLPGAKLTQDHIVPIARGGKHEWNNIVPACKSCNSRKHTKKAPVFQPVLPLRV